MRQRLNPWAVLLTAALTFGSLMAFVGPRLHNHRSFGHFREDHFRNHSDHHGHGGCDDDDRADRQKNGSRVEKNTVVPDSTTTR